MSKKDLRLPEADIKKLSGIFLKALEKAASTSAKEASERENAKSRGVKPLRGLERAPLVKFSPEDEKAIRQMGKKKSKSEEVLDDMKNILDD